MSLNLSYSDYEVDLSVYIWLTVSWIKLFAIHEITRYQLYLGQQAETRLRKQAEEADRAKLEFLRMMAHEIRTPLNGFAHHSHHDVDPHKQNCYIV